MKLEFTEQEMLLLDKAIQQLPYYLAAPLVASINKQMQSATQIDTSPK